MPPQTATKIDNSSTNDENGVKLDPSIAAGRRTASPEAGEEIVITGMAGKLPNSDSVFEFQENLYNKVEMMDEDTRRWEHNHAEIPRKAGKIYNADKFDARFFGIPQLQVDAMDPMMRILLEKTFEAICDAGYSMEELKGSNTGVFIGVCSSETEKEVVYEKLVKHSFSITGCLRFVLGIRISYFFKFEGPSYVLDTACSSSSFAFEHAYKAIRDGKCENAIVGGANLCLHQLLTLQFSRLGVLSLNDGCRAFDVAANGYTRSEAICVLFLQKAKNARRIFAKVIHAKVNSDGFKELGITYPSGDIQKDLLQDVYEECNVSPKDVTFVEAHGTGTFVGDPEEVRAIGMIFCKDREGPLHIGSVKSSIGHTEPSSGICSMMKVIVGMENGTIPPNIKFTQPRKDIEDLVSGRIRVVTDAMPWPNDRALVGINSFGFGGANAHIILERNQITKETKTLPDDDLPRLICVSGRTREATDYILDDLQKKYNVEFIKLIQEVFKDNIENHMHRSYIILTATGEISRESSCIFETDQKKLMYSFKDDIENAFELVDELKRIPLISAICENIDNIMKANRLSTNNNTFWSCVLNLALAEILKKLNFKQMHFQGYGLSLLACGYLSDCLTLEQTVLSAFALTQNKNDVLKRLEMLIPVQKKPSAKWLNIKEKVSARYFHERYLRDKIKQKSDVLFVRGSDEVSIDLRRGQVVVDLLRVLGNLYLRGENFKIHELFPEITYPVSRGTPMISHLIKWDHRKSWHVSRMRTMEKPSHMFVKINLKDEYWRFINGHIIDGRNLFPATGYLHLVWTTFAAMLTKIYTQVKVVFSDVKFLRATPVRDQEEIEFCIMISKSTGYFEICHDEATVVTGYIHEGDDTVQVINLPKPLEKQEDFTLNEHDIYKEFKLRGYQYKGLFKGVAEYKSSVAKLKWQSNWVAFMDNMLQVKLIEEDTRNLYVPTGIDYMVMDSDGHKRFTENMDGNCIEVCVHKELNIIKSEFIEIRGLRVTTIPRKKNNSTPILESYRFIPNQSDALTLQEMIRVNVQIVHENIPNLKFSVMELSEELQFEALIEEVLNDMPLIQGDFKTEETQVKSTKLQDKCLLITGKRLVGSAKLRDGLQHLTENGFVLSRESDCSEIPEDLCLITCYKLEDALYVLLRKCDDSAKDYKFFDFDLHSDWLRNLQGALAENPRTLIRSNDSKIGVLGLMNCLRREPNTKMVRCLIGDNVKGHCEEQLKKNLVINVYQENRWGTYRHLPLIDVNGIDVDHTFLRVVNPGDFSSMKWIEGYLKMDQSTGKGKKMIQIHCAALNFRDVMTASGRLTADLITRNRTEQNCLQGLEFSGIDAKGERVMGMVNNGALSNMVIADEQLLWKIPDEWSMEDAATVPVVYSTVLYALFCVTKYKRNQSILIHCGSGGIGQAALHVALYHGYEVFTTVGSQEKINFIRKAFPQVKPSRIGNSRDTTFEQMIYEETKGRGVDIVLNSLSEEKLSASIRCLAAGGTFLEIGKFDLSMNNALQMEMCSKQATFHGVMLDSLFKSESKLKSKLSNMMTEAIRKSYVKPLPGNIFKMDQVEEAFRFMASGKHIGKVLISVQKEHERLESFNSTKQFYCNPDGVYVVLGGLGGFGLELVDWLVIRGARKVLLTSRNGITKGYQQARIKTWKDYGTQIIVSKEDCSSKRSCVALLKEASTFGDVFSIFNLAVVLKDGVFENMTEEDFNVSFKPKYFATKFLDEASRVLCPKLKDFVVFSSVSCGRGNPGQTNYAMSNSFMERICEQRKLDGLPALAIQWGAIGDVGLVAEMQKEQTEIAIGGTLQQRITSCLEVLDVLLKQNEPVVSSMIIATKVQGNGGNSILDCVVQILGLRDIKTVSLHSTLPELGMDSIMGVEIKQALEMDFDVFLSPQDMRNLTLQKLMEIADSKEKGVSVQVSETKYEDSLKMFIGQFVDESVSKLRFQRYPEEDRAGEAIIVLPGIEGTASSYRDIMKGMNGSTLAMHYSLIQDHETSIKDVALNILPLMEKEVKDGKFKIICHSFGCCVALELVALLEAKGFEGRLAIIDGSPDQLHKVCEDSLSIHSESSFGISVIYTVLSLFIPIETLLEIKGKLMAISKFDEQIDVVMGYAPKDMRESKEYLTSLIISVYKKIKFILAYKPSFAKLRSSVKLYKPKIELVKNLPDDYHLSKYFERPLDVAQFHGNHSTILNNEDFIKDVCCFINE
ncbi:PREDICTED: fatty acid synthase-like [Nicrophorus vespilloides]|uniref:oleoyl-[acyl-carrier-protein] hydrolase n=1 Tax=Nicrophorus vespilloides TaxID=110193 RepID=A0ABM1NDL2_NICVS|nr:PREDICTED: fatty acid synthase-like [Nicrophorus vespilloides]